MDCESSIFLYPQVNGFRLLLVSNKHIDSIPDILCCLVVILSKSGYTLKVVLELVLELFHLQLLLALELEAIKIYNLVLEQDF